MKPVSKLFCIAAFISMTAILAVAQNDRTAAVATTTDKYVISAKAGGINFLEGDVSVVRKNGTSGRLNRRDEIEVGDKVSTGTVGRAEILLNPGSYMRVASNSTFEFRSVALESLQVRLDSGSAIFEVYASRDFTVRVVTPKAKMLLIESGVFRVDATPDGGARLSVFEGRALVSDRIATLLKKGQVAVLKDGGSTVAKLSKTDKDDFTAWSETRGKDLAKQTARIKNTAVRNSLLNSFNRGMWGMYKSFGLWIFDASWGGYSFLPFGYDWYSPYGYRFHNNIWGYHLPTNVYNPPVSPTAPTPTESYGRTLRVGSVNPSVQVPPFQRMEETYSPVTRPLRVGSSADSQGSPARDYSPSVRPSSSSPITSTPSPVMSVPSAPAPTESGPSIRPIKP